MQASSSRCFKALISKIHPQLPLNPRESQQLLSALTTSFRAQLDRQHPSQVECDKREQMAGGKHTAKHDCGTSSSRHHASDYLSSLLDNPLLSCKPSHEDATGCQSLIKDPTKWFENHVATGTADTGRAKQYLVAQRRKIQSVSDARRVLLMKETGAGHRVVRWIWTNQLSKELFGDLSLVRKLVPFLFAEGHHAMILSWLTAKHQVFAKFGVSEETMILFKARVFESMVFAELVLGSGLESALQTFQGAVSTEFSVPQTTNGKFTNILAPTGRKLVNLIWNSTELPKSTINYEGFLRVLPIWCASARARAVYTAMLHLRHPSGADTVPAMDLFRQIALNENHWSSSIAPLIRGQIAGMGLVLADKCLLQNQIDDAAWVLALLRQKFALETGHGARSLANASTHSELGNVEADMIGLSESLRPV